MNSERNINLRLLRLYPVKLLKEHFEVTGNQFDIVREIPAAFSTDSIKEFAVNNIGLTKQHIYFFNFPHSFDRTRFNTTADPFPLPIVRSIHSQRTNSYTFFCLPRITFTASIKNLETRDVVEQTLYFHQPVSITIRDRHIIIRATIVERNIAFFVSANSKAFDVVKTPDDDFVGEIMAYFQSQYSRITACDLNAGIKHLCDNDITGVHFASCKMSRSTNTVSMDAEFNLKEEYPDEYAELMRAPLDKVVLKYMESDGNLVSKFAAEPTLGKLRVNIYPEDLTQVNNVIVQILANN